MSKRTSPPGLILASFPLFSTYTSITLSIIFLALYLMVSQGPAHVGWRQLPPNSSISYIYVHIHLCLFIYVHYLFRYSLTKCILHSWTRTLSCTYNYSFYILPISTVILYHISVCVFIFNKTNGDRGLLTRTYYGSLFKTHFRASTK